MQSKMLLLALGALLAGQAARAVPVPDLYTAQVPSAGLTGPELDVAFDRALASVMIKVTGQRGLALDAAERGVIGPAASLVRRYQPLPGGQLRVTFEPSALHRRLDAANLPVWTDDRVLTTVVLPAAATELPMPAAGSAAPLPPAQPPVAPEDLFRAAATSRGIPVEFASAAGSAAGSVLTGRPAAESGPAAYRWTLDHDGERSEWQGDLAAGANGLADRLAARYATTAAAGRTLRVRIDDVDSFDDYGRVQAYLLSVGLIRSIDLKRVTGSSLYYDLAVRGDLAQLNDAFGLRPVLEPVTADDTREPAYRLVPGGL